VSGITREERITLFDVYGELLSAKQQEYFNLYYFEDLSLGEIAENNGVSRQAVQTAIEQAADKMFRLDKKLGVVSGRLKRGQMISQIESCIRDAHYDEAVKLLESIKE